MGSNPTLSAIPTGGRAQPQWYTSSRRNKNVVIRWDSNRVVKGICPLHGERTRGLAPSVGAFTVSADATSNSHPLRHPKVARTGCHIVALGDRPGNTPPVKFSLTPSCHERPHELFGYCNMGCSPRLRFSSKSWIIRSSASKRSLLVGWECLRSSEEGCP